jgi:hypothetical protein
MNLHIVSTRFCINGTITSYLYIGKLLKMLYEVLINTLEEVTLPAHTDHTAVASLNL